MKWSLTLIFSLMITAAALAAGPDDQYVAIYDLIQQGDSFAQSQPKVAAEKYHQAQVQLKQLQSVSPNWNKDIVDFRLGYLADKMQEFGKYLPAQEAQQETKAAAKVEDSPLDKPSQSELERQLVALHDQVQQLVTDKVKLESKLKEALAAQPAAVDPRELAKAEEKIAALSKERDLLAATLEQAKQKNAGVAQKRNTEAEVAALRKQLSSAQDELASVKSHSKKQTAALEAEVAKLKQANADAQERLAANAAPQLTTPAESEKVAALSRERDELKKQVDGLVKELADSEAHRDEDVLAAHAETAQLRAQLKEVQGQRAELEQKITALTQQQGDTKDTTRIITLQNQIQQLRDRLAVLEAKPIARTPEELALFKKADAQPAPALKGAHSVKDLSASDRIVMAEGQRLYIAKDYAGAEAKFNEVLKDDTSNVYVLAHIANTQLAENKTDACAQTVEQAVALDPEDAACLYILGKVRLRQDKVDEALDVLSHSVRINPTNALTQTALGNALNRKGMRDAAETALRKALQIDPEMPEAHHNLALVYATDQPPSVELAKWHYKKAMENGQPKDDALEKLLK
jgi:tetratricopeptide (TPR) repeat protein